MLSLVVSSPITTIGAKPLFPLSSLSEIKQSGSVIYPPADTESDVVAALLGQWTQVVAWAIIIYCFISVLAFIWLWTKGWVDNRLMVCESACSIMYRSYG